MSRVWRTFVIWGLLTFPAATTPSRVAWADMGQSNGKLSTHAKPAPHVPGIDKRDKDGWTALMTAAQKGDGAAVLDLIARGANVRLRGLLGETALALALSANDTPTIDALLTHGADVNSHDSDGKTPLMEAADRGNAQAFDALLARGADASAKDRAGASALMYVQSGRNSSPGAMIKTLLRRGITINATDNYGRTALMYGVDHDDESAVNTLLDASADPNLKDRGGETALMRTGSWVQHDVMMGGRDEWRARIAVALIDHGADVDAQESDGRTALMIAAGFRHYATLLALLDHGASVNIADRRGRTALTFAARTGMKEKIVSALLSRGASVGVLDAILMGDFRAAHALIATSAPIGVRSGFDETALIAAAEQGDLESVRGLLRRGADVRAVDEEKNTALIVAVAGRPERGMLSREPTWSPDLPIADRPAIVSALIAGHADINARNDKAETALSLAVRAGKASAVSLLLAAGADRGAGSGFPFMRQAAENGFGDVVRALLERRIRWTTATEFGKLADITAAKCSSQTLQAVLVAGASIHRPAVRLSALVSASAAGNVENVETLLAAGADVNGKDSRGESPLSVAAPRGMADPTVVILLGAGAHAGLFDALSMGDGPTARTLIAAGASFDPRNMNGRLPIVIAAEWGDIATVQALLDRNASLIPPNPELETPLIAAIRGHSHEELVGGRYQVVPADNPGTRASIAKLLIAHGAPIHDKRCIYGTPIEAACEQSNRELVEYLLRAGANPDEGRPDSLRAIMNAAQNGNADIVGLLLDFGADINAHTSTEHSVYSQNVIRFAAESGSLATVRLLLERHVDLKPSRSYGSSVQSQAQGKDREKIIAILQAAGEKE